MESATELSKEIKKLNPDLKILFVGPHASALPDDVLRDEPSIDFVCQNEGVYTISQLLSVEDKDNIQYLSKVSGLGFRDKENNIILNRISSTVSMEDMDKELPGMA